MCKIRKLIGVGKQLAFYFAIFFTLTFLLFAIFHGIGDPSVALTDQRIDPQILHAIRHQLGWDRPFLQRLFLFFVQLIPVSFSSHFPYLSFHLPNLGISFHYHEEVLPLYFTHLQYTLLLVLPSLLLATLMAILLGTWLGSVTSPTLKKMAHVFSMVGISLPSYFSAILLIALTLELFPFIPVVGFPFQIEPTETRFAFPLLLLPVLSLAIRPFALLFQMHMSSIEETLREPFIRTANAFGFPVSTVLFRYALRPAAIPTLTTFSNWLASLLGGTFFVEVIFQYPGVGWLLVNAIQTYDYPLVMGCCLMTAWLFLLIVLLTDFFYPLIDPRIRIQP